MDFSPPGFCWLNLANAIKTGPSLTWCVSCAVCLQVWIPGEDKLHQGVDCSQERRQSSLTCLFSVVWSSTGSGRFQHHLHQLWRLQLPSVLSAYAGSAGLGLRQAPPDSAGLQALSFVFIPSVPLLEKQSGALSWSKGRVNTLFLCLLFCRIMSWLLSGLQRLRLWVFSCLHRFYDLACQYHRTASASKGCELPPGCCVLTPVVLASCCVMWQSFRLGCLVSGSEQSVSPRSLAGAVLGLWLAIVSSLFDWQSQWTPI